jgi:4,5-dihydroxyphthalate decarboxylase
LANLSLTLACGPYDRMEALQNGLVRPEGIDLTYLSIQSPPEIFARMIRKHSFDLAEMSMSMYIQARQKGDFPFIALPVFPVRLFRHGYIFINKRSGITKPKDLDGKRIGVPEYRQTAAVWIRGLLRHEYGVDLDSIHWFEGGMNAAREQNSLDIRPPGPLKIDFVSETTLNQMLVDGELDACIGARRPAAMGSHPDIAKLFPDARRVEQEYYRKTGIFPMMHTVVIREEVLAANPWIAESMYKAFVQAKDWCLEQMRFSGTNRYMLPWLFDDLDEMDAVFGKDPWPYGLDPNRPTIEALDQYLFDQRFIARRSNIDELFVPLILANE